MAKLLLSALLLVCVVLPTSADTGEKVDFKTYGAPYFEKNNSGLKGEASYLVLPDKKSFDALFGIGVVMGKKRPVLSPDDFDKKQIVAVIERGNRVTTYKVESVTAADGVLTVTYQAMPMGAAGTATFASPLILTVDKSKYKSVTFIENGKKVDNVAIGKK
jgi:hypothetical protein